jgi:hypothetical protein
VSQTTRAIKQLSRREIQGRQKLVSRALEIGVCNEEIRAGDTAPESQEMRMSFVSPGARVEAEVLVMQAPEEIWTSQRRRMSQQ